MENKELYAHASAFARLSSAITILRFSRSAIPSPSYGARW